MMPSPQPAGSTALEPASPSRVFSRKEMIGLILLGLAAFVVGLRGILHYGHIGQDYGPHRETIIHFPESFSFHLTDPPAYYWLGGWIYHHLSPAYYLELTALTCLILNTGALALVYRFLWQSITHPAIRWAAAALVTFLPVRLIHGIVTAADALTLPVFVLVVLFTLQLRENPRRAFAWVGLTISLSVGLLVKYTFAGLLAPVALVLASTVIQQLPKARRGLGLVGVIAVLALPAALLNYEVRESAKEKGAMTDLQWLPPEAPSVMRWRDMLLPQASDLQLFKAPAYFRDALYDFRVYSYPGLVYISTVTDPFNLFQLPPSEISMSWDRRMQDGFFRDRSETAQRLMVLATALSFPFFLLAIVGTLVIGVLGLQALLTRQSHLTNAAVVLTAMAAGYYSPVFMALHRIANPYGEGFWTARLVLPAIMTFFGLGFVLLDLALSRWGRSRWARQGFPAVLLAWTAATCGVYIAFLF